MKLKNREDAAETRIAEVEEAIKKVSYYASVSCRSQSVYNIV